MPFLRTLPLLLVAMAAPACYVHPAPAVAVHEVAYEPVYHRQHVVYFDAGGAPYYRDNGRVVFVGRRDPQYRVYVDHYATHRGAYRSWAPHDRGPHRGRVQAQPVRRHRHR